MSKRFTLSLQFKSVLSRPSIEVFNESGKDIGSFCSDNLTKSHLTALTYVSANNAIAVNDDTFSSFVAENKNFCLNTVDFGDKFASYQILFPSYIKNESDIHHYLIDNGIYNVPSGYLTFCFIKFIKGSFKQCIKRIPIIKDRALPLIPITPKEKVVFGGVKEDNFIDGCLMIGNIGKLNEKTWFIVRNNVPDGSSMELSMMDKLCLFVKKHYEDEIAESKRKLKNAEEIYKILIRMDNN